MMSFFLYLSTGVWAGRLFNKVFFFMSIPQTCNDISFRPACVVVFFLYIILIFIILSMSVMLSFLSFLYCLFSIFVFYILVTCLTLPVGNAFTLLSIVHRFFSPVYLTKRLMVIHRVLFYILASDIRNRCLL